MKINSFPLVCLHHNWLIPNNFFTWIYWLCKMLWQTVLVQHHGTFQHVMIKKEDHSFNWLMARISEITNIILLVTRSFSLLRLACLFGIRIALTVIYTWTELIGTTISFHANIILRIITWTFGLISLPARVVYAFQRERQVSYHSVFSFIMIFAPCIMQFDFP